MHDSLSNWLKNFKWFLKFLEIISDFLYLNDGLYIVVVYIRYHFRSSADLSLQVGFPNHCYHGKAHVTACLSQC